MPFLNDREARPFVLTTDQGLHPEGLFLGNGPSAIEVAVVSATTRPTVAALRDAWRARVGGRAAPVLLVAEYGGKVAVVGPAGDQPRTYLDQEPSRVERICEAALDEPNRHAALRFLNDVLSELDSKFAGLRNEGFFASHELEAGVPKREDWLNAKRDGQPLLHLRDGDLLRGLGFTIERLPGPASVLRASESRVALAVLLERGEAPEIANGRFSNLTPISYALAKADQENLEYVVMLAGPVVRLYPVKTGMGTGQRGRTETYVEIRLDVLSEDLAGYLWLFFSARALNRDGTVQEILKSSSIYAADLGSRLRERIYSEVVPPLAEGVIAARRLRRPTTTDLADTYEMALVILFRLLFIAYAEDKELLPYKTNDFYRDRSLKKKAGDLTKFLREQRPFGGETTGHWEEVERLFRAVDQGNPEWGVPKYNGGLFSSDPNVSRIGAGIASLRIPDRVFGPVLGALLVDRTSEGWGPVDFRSLGVREFGTVYEGLLENELSIAESDLTTEVHDKQERYRPAKPKDTLIVAKGQAFLHNTSGARKSTGSYFTKHFAVEHLLEEGLEPALTQHLQRLDTLSEREAGEAFFDFRVADITMGSGHFLVAAVDRIERGFSTYIARRPLPEVADELQRLRIAASEALGRSEADVEIEDSQLLRRQIARRCIFGVDVNRIAVDLARLAIWVHTFVPGLPLSFLDHNLVVGNSLVGFATVNEANEWLKEIAGPLFHLTAEALVGAAADSLSRLARLSDANAAEIDRARTAFRQSSEAVQPARCLFDILVAARVDDDTRQNVWQGASHWQQDLSVLIGSKLHRSAQKVMAAIQPFHFPVAFPEVFLREHPGFNVVLGNPPWEEATVEEDRFWARHLPGFHSLPQEDQEKQKEVLRRERPDLYKAFQQELEEAQFLRRVLTRSGYPGMGTGDPDLYKAACWRFLHLIRSDIGRVAVVLPRSALNAKGSAEFRRQVFRAARFADITLLLNKGGWVFEDVEHRDTMALTSWGPAAIAEELVLPLRGPFNSLERYGAGLLKEPAMIKVSDVISWTDTAALPSFPSEHSVGVFVQLRKAPRLDEDMPGEWRVRPHTELHATNDKPLMTFSAEPPAGAWPVYKGESFDLWESDTGSYYAWAKSNPALREIQKSRLRASRLARSVFSLVPKEHLNNPDTLPPLNPRIAFRDIANWNNRRTLIAALIPPQVFLTNKAPYLVWIRGDELDVAYLLGVLSSISLDWYARRLVEKNVNFHIFDPLPIPRPPRGSAFWRRCVDLSARLACQDQRFSHWAKLIGVPCGKLGDAEKQDMVCELDAIVAQLYSLSEPQLRHIFETFHEGWDYHERLESTIGHFRKWQKKL